MIVFLEATFIANALMSALSRSELDLYKSVKIWKDIQE
jgi:hypothetical protein